MLKEQASLFKKFTMLLDAVTILGAFVLAYRLRFSDPALTDLNDYVLLLSIFVPVAFYLFSRYHLYASLRINSLFSTIYSLFKAHVIAGFFVAAGIYLIEQRHLSRGFFSLFLISSFVLLSAQKALVKAVLMNIRTRGYNYRNILIVGTGKLAEKFAVTVLEHASWGIRIVGFLHESDRIYHKSLHGLPVLGPIKDLIKVCKTTPVDEVVFCLSKKHITEIEGYVANLEELGITVRLNLNFLDRGHTKYEVSIFHEEIPLLTCYCKNFDAGSLFLKRCVDILGGLVGLAVTGLLFPFIAIAIKRDSPGPLFFGQPRVGERGRNFICWKFRSMTADADNQKKELLELNEVKGAMFKMKNDPRITRVGKFLRKTSLDELPQFWNVLRGEMSLVGTRPPTPDEVAKYENWHHRRICIKPGITGLWQVSGRNKIQDFDEIVRLDLIYIDTWNLLSDIKIIFRTIKVIFSKGGY